MHTCTQNSKTHNVVKCLLEHFSSGQTHSFLQHIYTKGATHPTAWQVGYKRAHACTGQVSNFVRMVNGPSHVSMKAEAAKHSLGRRLVSSFSC